MYIRLPRHLRQAKGFPLPDCFRDIKTLENSQMIGHLPRGLFIASAE
jgi:hypothetical protein